MAKVAALHHRCSKLCKYRALSRYLKIEAYASESDAAMLELLESLNVAHLIPGQKSTI